MRIRFFRLLGTFAFFLLSSCDFTPQTEEKSVALSTAGKEFAAGRKGVKLILSDAPSGSFPTPLLVPASTPIPLGQPGYGSGFHIPITDCP